MTLRAASAAALTPAALRDKDSGTGRHIVVHGRPAPMPPVQDAFGVKPISAGSSKADDGFPEEAE